MNELKPEDVMRALECHTSGCDCYGCPMPPCSCEDVLIENALALLREKDAEIKGLVDGWSKDQDRFEKVFAEKDARIEELEFTLLGVMHSVDKWLDGAELEKDEVNRAATMREKILRVVEEMDADYKFLEELYQEKCEQVLKANEIFVEKNAEIERLSHQCSECAGCTQWKCDCSNIRAEAIADVVAQLEAEVYSSDKYIAEYDGSKVQVAYNQGLKNALKIAKEMKGETE